MLLLLLLPWTGVYIGYRRQVDWKTRERAHAKCFYLPCRRLEEEVVVPCGQLGRPNDLASPVQCKCSAKSTESQGGNKQSLHCNELSNGSQTNNNID